jgi:thiamine-phosphate pyrophosphorylase
MINHSSNRVSWSLPKVYPITDTQLSGLSHAELVRLLISGGATVIQLRDKRASPREFYQKAAAALQVARAHDAKLIINDRVDIAVALKADGVHLGQTDIPVEAARHLLGQAAIIGFSTHNLEQAKLAMTLPIDYLAFGPVFETATKQNPDPVAGLNALRDVRASTGSFPLVAIGGITLENGADVLTSGADALAIISELVADPARIAGNMRQMLARTASSNPAARHG